MTTYCEQGRTAARAGSRMSSLHEIALMCGLALFTALTCVVVSPLFASEYGAVAFADVLDEQADVQAAVIETESLDTEETDEDLWEDDEEDLWADEDEGSWVEGDEDEGSWVEGDDEDLWGEDEDDEGDEFTDDLYDADGSDDLDDPDESDDAGGSDDLDNPDDGTDPADEGTQGLVIDFEGSTSAADVSTTLVSPVAKQSKKITGTTGTDSALQTSSTTWSRIAGDTRYETAQKITKEAFADNSSAVAIVTSAENFPDALSASAYAGLYNAPVIITASKALSDTAKSEITRIGAAKIFVIGGVKAVSSAVVAAIKALPCVKKVTRIAGENRVDTANCIAAKGRETDSWSDTCIIANGYNFADALSASSYAYANAAPIFLTNDNNTLDSSTVAEIKAGGYSRVVIVGGTSAVRSSVKTQLGSGIAFTRLGGQNRYETSTLIAEWALNEGMSADGLAFATSANYPDALSGSSLCGTKNSVILLVGEGTGSDIGITSFLKSHKSEVNTAYVLGGVSAVSGDLGRAMLKATGSTVDLTGATIKSAEAKYTGSLVKPSTITISGIAVRKLIAGNSLKLTTDFKVLSSSDATYVGTGTLKITGAGIYTGNTEGSIYVYLPTGVYTWLSAADSSLALDVKNASYYAGANVRFHTVDNTASQMFEVTYLGNGKYTFQNYNSKKMLDVENGGTTSGTNVRQWTDNGSSSQTWILGHTASGKITIASAKSGLVVGASSGVSNNKNAATYADTGADYRAFTFVSVPSWKTDIKEYVLEVNRIENVVNVYAYIGNGDYIAVKAMLCSCGADDATPIGTFSIYEKRRWSTMAGGTAAQFCSPFYGPYYLHSVPYWTYGDNSSLETAEYDLLGSNRSMGCIRLCCSDAEWIYDNCDIGTTVITYNSSNPGPFGKPDPIPRGYPTPEGWDPTDPLL